MFSHFRQPTQDAPEEVRARDFRRELEERERVAAREKTRERGPRGWSSCNVSFYIRDTPMKQLVKILLHP